MANAPGSYTNVFEYVDFIKNTIASGDCETVDSDTAQDQDGLDNVQDIAKEVVDKNDTKIENRNQEISVNETNDTLLVSVDT